MTRQSHDTYLMAYQIAFDLYESATQQFLSRIAESLRLAAPIASLISSKAKSINTASLSPTTTAVSDSTSSVSGPENMDVDPPTNNTSSGVETSTTSVKSEAKKEDLSEEDRKRQERIENLIKILSGDTTIELDLQFLIRNNKTDILILKNTKDTVRNSVCHNATVIANGLMHAGTTSDQFLRDNLDW